MSAPKTEKTGYDPFAARRDQWLLQVALDDRIKAASVLRYAVVIALRHWNRERNDAYPGQAKMMAALRLSEDSVSRARATLISMGHLRLLKPGAGRGNAGVLGFVLHDAKATHESTFGTEEYPARLRENNLAPGKAKAEMPRNSAENTPQTCAEMPRNSAENTPQTCGKNPARLPAQPHEEPHDGEPLDLTTAPAAASGPTYDVRDLPFDASARSGSGALSGDVLDGEEVAFAAFWAAYPKQVAQEKAREAFGKVVTSGVPPEALIGAARCAAEVFAARLADGEARAEVYRYTKYPANFLEKGNWRNAPAEAAMRRTAARAPDADEFAAYMTAPSVLARAGGGKR